MKNTQSNIQSREETYFPRLSEGLADLAVASSVAGGDEVGDAAALQERGGRDGTGRAE